VKTKYKYIEMQKMKTIDKKRKTDIYIIKNIKSQSGIGKIKWNPGWRQYCFFPNNETVFSQGCLDDINNFLEQLKQEKSSKE